MLWLSLRSLSLDEEMRFRMHRALAGDPLTPLTCLNTCPAPDSIETLASAEEPVTWTEKNWPHTGVTRETWGDSLTCASLKDKGTKAVLPADQFQCDSEAYEREFDFLSRAFVTEQPLQDATLVLHAHAASDNHDCVVLEEHGWPGKLKLKGGQVPPKPRYGAAKRLAYLQATDEGGYPWHPSGVQRSLQFPLYASYVPGATLMQTPVESVGYQPVPRSGGP